MQQQTDRVRLHPFLHTLAFLVSLIVVPNLYFLVISTGGKHLVSVLEVLKLVMFISAISAMFGGIPALLTALFSYQFQKAKNKNDTEKETAIWFGLTLLFGTVISLFCMFVMALIFSTSVLGNNLELYMVMGGMGLFASLVGCSGVLLLEWLINRRKQPFLNTVELAQ